MKRETLRHPKTLDLAARLGCEIPTALGYLILLWDFTADHAIQGNIGKWPDGSIAGACQWKGDGKEFVDALVEARWLDRDRLHRLMVHDWKDHCERWVKMKMEKLNLSFAEHSAEPSTEASTERSTDRSTERSAERPEDANSDSTERSAEPSSPRDQTKPIQTKPIQTKPKRSRTGFDPLAVSFPAELDTPEFRACWSNWVAHRIEKRKPLTERQCQVILETARQMGAKCAIEKLNRAIGNGWTGWEFGENTNGTSDVKPSPLYDETQRKDPTRGLN